MCPLLRLTQEINEYRSKNKQNKQNKKSETNPENLPTHRPYGWSNTEKSPR